MLCFLTIGLAAAHVPDIPTTALPAAVTPPTIDGILDEAVWDSAVEFTEFKQYEPKPGGAPPDEMTIRLLVDDTALYLGAVVTGSKHRIRGRIAPRGWLNDDDQIGIYLDPFDDERAGYVFYVNAIGVQQDIRIIPGAWSFYWDTVFETAGVIHDDQHGYTVEMAIPFRSLRYPKDEGVQTWGMLLSRKSPVEGIKYAYPDRTRRHPRIFSQSAPVTLTPPTRGGGIDIIGGLTATHSMERESFSDDLLPIETSSLLDSISPSIEDMRLGLTPNTEVSLSVNPDFSQIELDDTPIDLNQRFAFQYDENRPFFLDGMDLTTDIAESLYTRSVVEPLYGIRVGGREGPVSIGVLHALDLRPEATINENGTPGFEEEDLEGRAAINTMMRLRLDAFNGGSVGLVFADKQLTDSDAANDAMGIDLEVPLGGRWLARGASLWSHTSDGDESLSGGHNMVTIKRQSGDGLGFKASFDDITPGLRKELGYAPQAGIQDRFAHLDYTFSPLGPFDRLTPELEVSSIVERDSTGLSNGEREDEQSVGVKAVFGGVQEIETRIGNTSFTEGIDLSDDDTEVSLELVSMSGPFIEVEAEAEIGSVIQFEPSFKAARLLDYSTLTPADFSEVVLALDLRPTPGLWLMSEWEMERLQPDNLSVEKATAIREKLYWQFTRSLGLRLIGEYTSGNTIDSTMTNSALFTWLASPGTSAMVGAVQVSDADNGYATLNRSIFAKVTVLLRP